MHIISVSKAIKNLQAGSIDAEAANGYFIAYAIYSVICTISTAGVYLIVEAITLAISYRTNNYKGMSKDFLARFFIIGFPAHIRFLVFWWIPLGILGLISSFFIKPLLQLIIAIVVIALITSIGLILCVIKRCKGIARVAKVDPQPTGLFGSK